MTSIRFYRRIPLIPGLLHLNLSKGGISLSLGERGWGVTFGRNGIRFTAGLIGTGLSVSEQVSYEKLENMNPLSHNSEHKIPKK